MNIFVTWSGMKNKRFANAVADFFSDTLNNISILYSFSEGKVSKEWVRKNIRALKKSSFGIICLDSSELNSSTTLRYIEEISNATQSKLYIILQDSLPKNTAIPYFIKGFVQKSDKNQLKSLVELINSNSNFPIRETHIRDLFESHYSRLKNLSDQISDDKLKGEESSASIRLYFDLNEYSSEEIATAISFLSELYNATGGDMLIIDDMKVSQLAYINEPLIIA